jgi:hypothetical protein
MKPEHAQPPGDPDEVPRPSLLAAMPKRSFFRVLMLLGALVGIFYLREHTSSISTCMSNAFRMLPAPASEPASNPVRARIELRPEASTKVAP